ncbi:HNH endonuclease [Sulfidibacter corallicola]|uniref:HNH endonuclease n=1 Tax=Sulfidibacter corallicola TaxID=2818388 RepID=A0A8A4TNR1_SULCO|nr:HNH endonuclease [Sulfidibacter corallicola]QTD51067.1 HNH endonuclease [Sulfidibacter corallicola]
MEKGLCPSQWRAGESDLSKDYGDAKVYLVERIGPYCSYCELFIGLGANRAIEHKIAKAYRPSLRNTWTNLLISCTMCNSHKTQFDGKPPSNAKPGRDFDLDAFLWPDRDNTMLAFEYRENGDIDADTSHPANVLAKAQNTIGMFRFNQEDSKSDTRKALRRAIWHTAKRHLNNVEKARQNGANWDDILTDLLDIAKHRGFWTVWMVVFQDHPEVLKALIEGFAGTASSCFDEQGRPLKREGGRI